MPQQTRQVSEHAPQAPIVQMEHITKRFPGVVALDDVQIQIHPGEIHGLVGENGAGKSTLIKVLMGVHKADEGTILVKGQKVTFAGPNDAAKAGIACVYQELNIEKLLNVTDNIFMNKWLRKKSGLLDYKTMHEQTDALMESLGQKVDTHQLAGTFGMGVQQMIEIAKALLMDSKVIIMDEPTSSLGEKEVEQLKTTCRILKDKGVGILFITHKLEELFELCDRVTVMRDGKYIFTKPVSELDNQSLITAMVGRTLENQFPKQYGQRGPCLLKVENLTSYGLLDDVTFEAYAGEVVAFAGLVGAGRTETMSAIFGAIPLDKGDIYVRGNKVTIKNPNQAIKQGIAFLTEDRKGQGLVLSQPVYNNLIMASLKDFTKGLFLQNNKIEERAANQVEALQIKTPTIGEVVHQLSGGNQQKVVIGKWLNTNADIYIFDEPTRGIDVGAKVEVYNTINDLVAQGKAVIMVSSEMPEVLGMSDRVIVMRDGRVMATIDRSSPHFNQESIMKAAWGGNLNE